MLVTLDAEQELAAFRAMGFGSVTGGQFADGVRNWTIPMVSGQYVEVLTVDAGVEGTGAEWIHRCVDSGRRFAGWGVEVPSVDGVAQRLGLRAEPGAPLDGGKKAPWRNVDAPPDQSFLPFFITYDWTNSADEDGKIAAWQRGWLERAGHEVTPLEISRLDLVGDEDVLLSWLGGDLPVSVVAGAPARLEAIHIRTESGDVVIRGDVRFR